MSSGRSCAAIVVAAMLAACGQAQQPASSAPAASQSQPPQPPPPPPVAETPMVASATGNDVDAPPAITDADIPPLPVTQVMAARPMEIVRAVYVFAAKHPEVLNKVPCFCGCETRGHRHNDDCFVAKRDVRGRPTEWEPHGVG